MVLCTTWFSGRHPCPQQWVGTIWLWSLWSPFQLRFSSNWTCFSQFHSYVIKLCSYAPPLLSVPDYHFLYAPFLSCISQRYTLPSQVEVWAACHLVAYPSHLCPQNPTVTFNLLEAFPDCVTDAYLNELPEKQSENQIKPWHPLCNITHAGSRQAAKLHGHLIWVASRMRCPAEGEVAADH